MVLNRSRSGAQDRRGFDLYLKGLLVSIPLTLVFMVFFSWKIGLALFMICTASFICVQSASAPPANNPREFIRFLDVSIRRRPIMVCLGDSLTHGTISSSFTPDIPRKLAEKLGMEPPSLTGTFVDPLWVVNSGQNGITSYTVRTERVQGALRCHPDYILLWIGSNDVLAMYKESWSKGIVRRNALPVKPSMENLERNVRGIIDFIQHHSMQTHIGVCTLPPMGENLTNSRANDLIRQANVILEKVVNGYGDRCTVVPIYKRFESILEKKPNNKKNLISVDYFFWVSCWMNAVYYLLPPLASWNGLSKPLGHMLLSDGVHLNDNGRDVVVDVVVEWLLSIGVAKAIAVKNL